MCHSKQETSRYFLQLGATQYNCLEKIQHIDFLIVYINRRNKRFAALNLSGYYQGESCNELRSCIKLQQPTLYVTTLFPFIESLLCRTLWKHYKVEFLNTKKLKAQSMWRMLFHKTLWNWPISLLNSFKRERARRNLSAVKILKNSKLTLISQSATYWLQIYNPPSYIRCHVILG